MKILLPLTKHALENLHYFDFENAKILEYKANYNKITILEMIHITNNNNSVNNKTDITFVFNF